ncbi:MAG: amidohydrolase family protein [Chloroflexota bacterium]
MKIIDIHAHLGDILYPQKPSIIWGDYVAKRPDWNDVYEQFNWPEWDRFHRIFGKLAHRLNILAGQNRNRTATLVNLQRELETHEISRCVVLAVFPHAPTADIMQAAAKEPRIVPFTGPYYNAEFDLTAKYREEVASGVCGLKLHPILNCVRLDSPENFASVEAFAPHNKPVLFHSGYAFYYAKKHEQVNERPDFGEISHATPLIEAFPNVKFIAGHSGLGQADEAIEIYANYPNVYVDTSFQPPHMIKRLTDTFGPDRVLYGSDWPWGGMGVAKRCVELACGHDAGLKRQIFHDNSALLIDG